MSRTIWVSGALRKVLCEESALVQNEGRSKFEIDHYRSHDHASSVVRLC